MVLNIFNEAWNFYIGLFHNENMAVRVATFTATLATLTSLITFVIKPAYGWLTRRFANIKVESTFQQQLIQDWTNNFSAGDPLLTVIVTNRSRSVKYIQAINIRTSRKVDGERFWSMAVRSGTYPIQLEPEQQHRRDFPIGALTNTVLNKLRDNDRVSILVSDTTGKIYLSKSIKVSYITGQIRAAQGFNRGQA